MNAPNAIPELPGIDTVEGLKRVMNRTALYEKVLREFHSRFSNEHLRIRSALVSGDLDDARRRAHSTKGLAGTIGAHALQEAAKEIEASLTEAQMPTEEQLARLDSEIKTVTAGIAQAYALPPAAE